MFFEFLLILLCFSSKFCLDSVKYQTTQWSLENEIVSSDICMEGGNSNQNVHCLVLKPMPPAPDFRVHSPPQSCTQGSLLVSLRSVESFLSTLWSSLSKKNMVRENYWRSNHFLIMLQPNLPKRRLMLKNKPELEKWDIKHQHSAKCQELCSENS